MYHFEYVKKEKTTEARKSLEKVIHDVQECVRGEFTFKYNIVGSAKRNMITEDVKSNIGYDFDYNIEVNDYEENYEPKEIRDILRDAFNHVAPKYGYNYCEDSTRVLTIKKAPIRSLNTWFGKSPWSCDFAVVRNYKGKQQYIRYNKDRNTYTWEWQGKGFENLDKKFEYIKRKGYWRHLSDYYLDKKNNSIDPNKHSRSLFAEAVNEIYAKCYNK